MAAPTLAMTNSGPEVEHSGLILVACASVIKPFSRRSASMRLPTG